VIELLISRVDNDYVYYGETANGSLPSGGRRSRIVQLDRLITYIKSKREVVCDHGAGSKLREPDALLKSGLTSTQRERFPRPSALRIRQIAERR
jgi:hypothetical protein